MNRITALFTLLFAPVLLLGVCSCSRKNVVFEFPMDKTMPGRKVSLKTFDKDFPTDWSTYNYLVLEMTSSTAQRVYMGVTTEEGYNELRFIFYAPGGWIRTAIPLTYFRDQPSGAHDLAATYNHKRPLSYINIQHGTRHPLVGVDSIGFRMHLPVKDEKIEVSRCYLSVDAPGDEYLSSRPAVDEFGQWNIGEFEGKIHSEVELKAEWAVEDSLIATVGRAGLSIYGGDLDRKADSTGWFHVAKVDGKWWFVDPDGYCMLSISSNGMSPGGPGIIRNPLKGIYTETPPEGFIDQSDIPSTRYLRLTEWNNYRRFGTENVQEKAIRLVVDRMNLYGVNTIGNWSSQAVIDMNLKPFMVSLRGLGIQNGILGMPDVYADGFVEAVAEGVKESTERYVNDKMLIGYFVGNEPTWSNQELRLCELIGEADDAMPLKQAMLSFLKSHGNSPESRKAFVYHTFDKFLSAVDIALRRYDPNHLNLGIRYGSGVPSPEVLALSRKYFDVYSFNNYGVEPNLENVNTIYSAIDKPMIIGEFHFGTTDRGLGESLVRVVSQKDRGTAYRNYAEKAFSHEALIGVSWFTWYDQPFFGRGDGENYNIGIFDATDRPYKWMVKAIRDVADCCNDVHAGIREPFHEDLHRVEKDLPDIWEK